MSDSEFPVADDVNSEQSFAPDGAASSVPAIEATPRGIDPVLLYVWRERRKRLEEAEAAEQARELPPQIRQHHKLSITYAAYLGVVGMIAAIIFGLLGEVEPREIIDTATTSLFAFAAIGYVFGWIAEFCVRESVIFMLREVVRRGDEALANQSEHEA
ncbi:MAG: hypothetical protein ACRC46_04285 [Thermoguttaceae bacterium]